MSYSDNDCVMDYHNGCPADMTKIEPVVCGCGMANNDTDEDGMEDCIDGCPGDMSKRYLRLWRGK